MLVFIRTLILMQKASQNIICKNFSIIMLCFNPNVRIKIVNILYAVIMTRKVGLWCFFIRETNEKNSSKSMFFQILLFGQLPCFEKNLQFNIFESKSM